MGREQPKTIISKKNICKSHWVIYYQFLQGGPRGARGDGNKREQRWREVHRRGK